MHHLKAHGIAFFLTFNITRLTKHIYVSFSLVFSQSYSDLNRCHFNSRSFPVKFYIFSEIFFIINKIFFTKDDEGKGDEAKQATDSAEAESANKDEAAEGEDAAGSSKAADKKKFTLPKVNIKTPKVISDIRAKSKERKKVRKKN